MSDETALLTAIRDNLDDVTLRLVYADWLDEHGNAAQRARAEFIRVQCELSDLYAARKEQAERYAQLSEREEELATQYVSEWLKGFPIAKVDVSQDSFARGFLTELPVNARRCAKSPRPPWEREPLLGVTLSGTATDISKLAAKGWFDGVLELSLEPSTHEQTQAATEAIANSTCAHTLRKLSLWGEGFGDGALEAIAGGAFRDLRQLSCMGQFTPDGWESVLNAPSVNRLEELTMGYRAPWNAESARPGSALAAVLISAPVIPQLKFLWLCGCGLDNAGLSRFATRGTFTHLKKLHIDNDAPGVPAVRAIGNANFPALTNLRLSQCELRDTALKALVDSPLMKQIEQLELSLNRLTGESAKAIANSRNSRALKYLDLGCNPIRDDGTISLMKSRKLGALEELHLSSTEMGNDGADAVLEATWTKQLTTLFMSYNTITKKKQAELSAKFGSVLWIDGVVDD